MALDPVTAIAEIGGKLIDRYLPDPIQAQQAKADFEQKLKDGDLKELELVIQDRISARQREVGVQDSTTRVLAYIIICAFVGMVAMTLMGYARIDSALAGSIIGYLSAKAEQVASYYFGSSRGSDHKTELLAKADAVKED